MSFIAMSIEQKPIYRYLLAIGGRYRGTLVQQGTLVPRYIFSTGTVGTSKKKYRYRSGATFISQFLGGTRYFRKIFYNKKRSLHILASTFRSNRLKDLFLKYNIAILSSAAIESFFSTGKDIRYKNSCSICASLSL